MLLSAHEQGALPRCRVIGLGLGFKALRVKAHLFTAEAWSCQLAADGA